jgi:hypothetical protein
MSENEEAHVIARAMRCSIRFEDSTTAVLTWGGNAESWRVVRRGAGWRSLLDLAQQMAAVQEAA